ncbi:MAG: hypothetical protein IJX25_00115 [Clostridia bacterium]|nr:hypothetical protein [Clostridia bacterium]
MEKKFIAELTKWNGEVIEQEIQEDWIQSIVDAVVGQFFFADVKSKFSISGADFKHVNIYEVAG